VKRLPPTREWPACFQILSKTRRGRKHLTRYTALALRRSQDTLGTLFRYEAALMNAFNRTLQQLLFLQDRRAREEDESMVVDVLPSSSN
jgi:hypothetical protein